MHNNLNFIILPTIASLAFGDNNMLLADGVIEDDESENTEQEGNSMEQE